MMVVWSVGLLGGTSSKDTRHRAPQDLLSGPNHTATPALKPGDHGPRGADDEVAERRLTPVRRPNRGHVLGEGWCGTHRPPLRPKAEGGSTRRTPACIPIGKGGTWESQRPAPGSRSRRQAHRRSRCGGPPRECAWWVSRGVGAVPAGAPWPRCPGTRRHREGRVAPAMLGHEAGSGRMSATPPSSAPRPLTRPRRSPSVIDSLEQRSRDALTLNASRRDFRIRTTSRPIAPTTALAPGRPRSPPCSSPRGSQSIG